MTFAVDGRTFQVIDRQELVKVITGMGGKIINYGNQGLIDATNGQAGTGLAIVFDCKPTVDNIADINGQLAERLTNFTANGQQVDTFMKCVNDIATPAVQHIQSIVTTPITMDMSHLFNGFAFVPAFAESMKNRIKVSFGSEAKKAPYITVSKMKQMTFDELESAIEKAGVRGNDSIKYMTVQNRNNQKISAATADVVEEPV